MFLRKLLVDSPLLISGNYYIFGMKSFVKHI